MKTFEGLLVWQKAYQLVVDIYRATKCLPAEERYGLVAQMRRAAVSVSANIVEGHKRRRQKEFSHFIAIAEGSLEELKYYLRLCKDLAYLSPDLATMLFASADEIGRMLHGLKTHVRRGAADEALV